jgi:hypothetical protein
MPALRFRTHSGVLPRQTFSSVGNRLRRDSALSISAAADTATATVESLLLRIDREAVIAAAFRATDRHAPGYHQLDAAACKLVFDADGSCAINPGAERRVRVKNRHWSSGRNKRGHCPVIPLTLWTAFRRTSRGARISPRVSLSDASNRRTRDRDTEAPLFSETNPVAISQSPPLFQGTKSLPNLQELRTQVVLWYHRSRQCHCDLSPSFLRCSLPVDPFGNLS